MLIKQATSWSDHRNTWKYLFMST